LVSSSASFVSVGRIEELEKQIQALSVEELAEFRKWFFEFDAARWDRRIEENVRAGKLYELAEEALDELKAGKCTDV
jgi:hypothetical protein